MKIRRVAYMGIDNGINGGVSLIDGDGKWITSLSLPLITYQVGSGKKKRNRRTYHLPGVVRTFKNIQASYDILGAALEKTIAFPGQSSQSTSTTSELFGVLKGVLSTLGIPYMLVSPQTWVKDICGTLGVTSRGRKFKSDAKQKGKLKELRKKKSLDMAVKLFSYGFVPNQKKKAHDGWYESALMAEWARRKIQGVIG